MKKLIPILSTLPITSVITPLTIVCTENRINEGETKIDDSTNSKEIIDKDFNFVKNYWYFSNIFTSPNFNKLIFLQKPKFDNIFWAHKQLLFTKLKEELKKGTDAFMGSWDKNTNWLFFHFPVIYKSLKKIEDKIKEDEFFLALDLFFKWLLEKECLTEFWKSYRFDGACFNTSCSITWGNLLDGFSRFLTEKYGFSLKIRAKNQVEEYSYLVDGFNKIEIIVNLWSNKTYKKTYKFEPVCSGLYLHFWNNDAPSIIMDLRISFMKHHFACELTKNEKFTDANEFVDCLNKNLNRENIWKDVRFELNEDYFTNSIYYCQNPERKNCKLMLNFVCINICLNNSSVWLIVDNVQTKLEIDNPNEFYIYGIFNNFIVSTMPHIKIGSGILNNNIFASSDTYQNFVDYLNYEFSKYCKGYRYLFAIKIDVIYIKLDDDNKDRVFTNGKKNVKLLIAKNEKREQYIEYCLPVYWHDGFIDKMLYNDPYFYLNNIFENYNGRIKWNYWNWIKSSELKEGQSQKDTYNLILEKINGCWMHYHYDTSVPMISDIWNLLKILSIKFINPDKPLKKDFNIVSVIFEADGFKFQVDLRIDLIDI